MKLKRYFENNYFDDNWEDEEDEEDYDKLYKGDIIKIVKIPSNLKFKMIKNFFHFNKIINLFKHVKIGDTFYVDDNSEHKNLYVLKNINRFEEYMARWTGGLIRVEIELIDELIDKKYIEIKK